jgi:fructosamine-3-kinase
MIPEVARCWLLDQGFGEVTDSRAVGGGCINNGARLQTSSGTSFFLKTNTSIPADYWIAFGHQMAALHNHTHQKFGFETDNYIGSTPQPNPWTEDGYQFYAEHRFVFQAELSAKRGLLNAGEVEQVRALAQRLPELVPAQPASLLHGDLWGGNAMADRDGRPAIIDPAVYYGWAEADLAMTALFGGFTGEFYSAYNQVRPLADGWRDRFSLYNLYHLLNHLNLFGRGYYGQVIQTVRRWG